MFKRILVLLDGSPRAERALLVVARLARVVNGTVILVRGVGITPAFNSSLYGPYLAQTPMITQEVLDMEQARAGAYIELARQSSKLSGITVETKVVVDTASVTIRDIVSEAGIDLIVLCSHSDTGFRRWALGSVAQRVSRTSRTPVLVLSDDGSMLDGTYSDTLHPFKALVALNGSEFAEAAILPTATLVAALAAPAQGTLLLMRVVPLSAPGNTAATKELALNKAKTYLRQVKQQYADRTEKLCVQVQFAVATGKEVAETLIRSAEQGDDVEGKCDVIVITTHGRGGLPRMVMGSVTEHVLGATKLPLLVMHSPV